MRKHEIMKILVHYFVDEEIFNHNALSLIVDVKSVSSSKELELKFQIRQKFRKERKKENGKRDRGRKENGKEKGREKKEKGKEREKKEKREREGEIISIKNEGNRNARKSKSAEAKD